jgi:DUF2911 family protein
MNIKYWCSHLVHLGMFVCLLSCGQSKEPPPSNQITVTPPPASTLQDASTISVDKSPMDMSYYPVDYPKQKMMKAEGEPLIARVIYSRPRKDKRLIFGDVVKYGSPWRLGANEATEIEFFTNVTIHDRRIPKGRYVFYCIPYPEKWKLILSNDLYTWGLKFDPAKDAYSFEVPVKKPLASFERFTMEFEKVDKGIELHIAWDTLYASLPIRYQDGK